MPVQKTTSPELSPSYPNEVPSNLVPSSNSNVPYRGRCLVRSTSHPGRSSTSRLLSTLICIVILSVTLSPESMLVGPYVYTDHCEFATSNTRLVNQHLLPDLLNLPWGAGPSVSCSCLHIGQEAAVLRYRLHSLPRGIPQGKQ